MNTIKDFSLPTWSILSIYTCMKRGAVKKADCKLINVWFPEEVIPLIETAVERQDTDRSKFIRTAVREKLERSGVEIPHPK